MKNLILSAALITISLQGALYAQDDNESYVSKLMKLSKAEQTFNANEYLINIRDFITLKEGRLILELSGVDDYNSFTNLDSILREFRKDIAFYKDSLESNPTGNVRIDYSYSDGFSFKKIRFKKYNPDGNMFLNQQGEISKLKFEQDTVRIVIQKSKPGLGRSNWPCMIPYSIQATFLLDNYYDIDKVIADNVLKGIVDTLEKTSDLEKYKGNRIYSNQFSLIYNPYYTGKGSLQQIDRLMKNEYDIYAGYNKSPYMNVNACIGAGMIRNTLTPTAEIGLQYNKIWNPVVHNIFRVSVEPYCFFDKNEHGDFVLYDNWFVNADVGSIYNYKSNPTKGWIGKECTFGVGYLAVEKGGYFKNTTFKVFTDILLIRGLTIVPEFIFTDNCRQIFPGITLKVF
jgi:hypothetical protein